MRARVSFAQALCDPKLLGASFTGDSWRPWHIIAKMISGEMLSAADMALVTQCTGRTALPKRPTRLVLLCGRRSGKSRFMSALAVWMAALAADWRKLMAPGEAAVVSLIACDRKQARVLEGYCAGLLQAPLLRSQVRRRTMDRTELRSGGVLEVTTNDARLIRGRSAVAILGDEVAFWRSDGESASSDAEVMAAAMPSLMTAPGGGFVVLSSTTYRKKGVMFDKWREFYGKDDASDLVWLAPSTLMNTSLPAEEIEREIASDPIKNKSEYLSTWRDDISGFISEGLIEQATDWGVTERPWSGNFLDKYCAFVDGAAGATEGRDSFALSIFRGNADGTMRQERLIEFVPPFNPVQVVAELAVILKSYGLNTVTGDASGWAATEFMRHGIAYPQARPKSELYLSVLPMLVSGRIRLLDNLKLRRQFASLERTVRAGGHEKIEEPLRSGFHDDLCNVTAGAAVTMSEMLAREPQIALAGIGVHSAPRVGVPGIGGSAEDAAYAYLTRGGYRNGNGGLCW
jgi:hypothetical protein